MLAASSAAYQGSSMHVHARPPFSSSALPDSIGIHCHLQQYSQPLCLVPQLSPSCQHSQQQRREGAPRQQNLIARVSGIGRLPHPDGEPNHGEHTGAASPAPVSFLGRVKRFFLGDAAMDRQKLAALGMGAFAAYGLFSNLNAGVLTVISWLTVMKTTGQTPLDPGMWVEYFKVYGALYLSAGSLTRPLRLSFAIAAAPTFERALGWIQSTLRVNKAVAYTVMLIGIGSFSITFFLVSISAFGGFPNGLPDLGAMMSARAVAKQQVGVPP